MKIAHDTLVMVADGKKLLLFRNEGDEKYPVLVTVLHQERSSAATHVQGSDRPGRSFSSLGKRRSSYGNTDWHEQDEESFAAHVAEVLERATAESDAGIVVLAPPPTLGMLRDHWGPHTRIRLLTEIHNDFTHRTTDEIIQAIAAHA